MSILRTIAIALGYIFGQQEPAAVQRHEAENDYRKDVVAALQGVKAEIQRQAERNHTHDTQKLVLAWLAFVINVITMVAVIYYAVVTYRQLGELKRQADLTRQSFTAVQRAFVFFSGFDHIVAGDTFLVSLKWENSGTTPTRAMVSHANWQFFPQRMPDDFTFPDDSSANNPTLIGPKSTIYFGPLAIPAKYFVQGHTHLFVWGWTEYNDVFEGTERHRTEFCGEIVLLRVNANLELCPRHNCSDRDCPKAR
jgi:hypothetical protein